MDLPWENTNYLRGLLAITEMIRGLNQLLVFILFFNFLESDWIVWYFPASYEYETYDDEIG